MITIQLVDNLFSTSILLIPTFAIIGLPFVIFNNEKVSNYCLGGVLLSVLSCLAMLILQVWS